MSGPVIVGVEPSERSRDALKLGTTLAAALDAEVMPVHVSAFEVLIGPLAGAPPRKGLELMGELATRDLEATRTVVSEAGGPEVQPIEASSVPAGLHKAIEEQGAELVVLGSSQQGRLGKIDPALRDNGCYQAVQPR